LHHDFAIAYDEGIYGKSDVQRIGASRPDEQHIFPVYYLLDGVDGKTVGKSCQQFFEFANNRILTLEAAIGGKKD
jgi:hypothetical protein